MRNLSLYQSVLVAILNKGWGLYGRDGGAGAERQGDKDENEVSGILYAGFFLVPNRRWS